MQRREALRLLATAAALPLIPDDLFALLRTARAQTAASPTPRALSPHQYETVTRIAEIILPETNTPGATSVHVNDFIDLMLTEWYSPEERAQFLSGLDDTDARSQKLFGKTFLELSNDQQAEIVRILDDEMAANFAKTHDNGDDAQPPFFHNLKRLTLVGYYTSEAGAKQELHFKMITGHYVGCVPAGETKASQ
jgi:hypothetical protein